MVIKVNVYCINLYVVLNFISYSVLYILCIYILMFRYLPVKRESETAVSVYIQFKEPRLLIESPTDKDCEILESDVMTTYIFNTLKATCLIGVIE